MDQKLINESSATDTQANQVKPLMVQLSPAEHLIDQINGEGKFQVQSFFIFSFMWFLTSWLLLGMGFFFDNSYTCSAQFSDQQACQKYICQLSEQLRNDQIQSHASSIIFHFDTYLICQEHQTQVSLLQSMLFVGSIFGFFVIPYVADNYGRKLAMRSSWGIGTVAVMILCIADSPNMVGLSLFLIGFGTNPAITLCFSFINEICLGKSKARYGVGVQMIWAFGETTIALLFATNMTWLAIAYIVLVTFIIQFVLVYLFVEETPMFMLKKSSQGALQVLNRMAKVNKRQPLTLQAVDRVERGEQQQFFQEQRSLGFFDLFRYSSIRWISISGSIIFFSIQLMYYSSQLNQGSVGFNKTINQIIFGVSQMFGYFLAQILIHKVLRKKFTFLGLGVSAGMCLLLGFLVSIETPENEETFKWIETVALMINRFILCCFWSIFYVYVSQLYPTEIRSLGFGWTSVVGQIGSTISPFIKSISTAVGVNTWFPTAFLGALAWFFIFCLPQTFGVPTRDEILERTQRLRKEKSELQLEDPDDDDYDYYPASEVLIPINEQEKPKIGVRSAPLII